MINDIKVEDTDVIYTGFVNGFQLNYAVRFHMHNAVDAQILASALDNVAGVEITEKG